MSFSVIQAGTDLKLVSNNGDVSSALTLPTGVTLRDDLAPRFTVFGRYTILVNTPSQPLTIDALGTVRLLTPTPPRSAPTLSGATSGTLTGNYSDVRYTFVTFDLYNNLISESDFSPASGSVSITNKLLTVSNIDTSSDQISGRRIYRGTTNGAVLFQWVDLDGNILTTVSDDLADAGLSLVAAPTLGTPPDLTLIAEFRDRLWGVGRLDIDDLVYTEIGLMYAWPADNSFPIPSVGSDFLGIKALMPRREALGIARQNQLLALTGTDDTNFNIIKLSQNCGVISQESVSVYRDVAYFLWEDGVYSWGDEGIQCLSDGKVRSWFTKDDIFNRGRFQFAFGKVDPIRNKYRLFLNEAGSSTNVLWIEYDLNEKTWWGPHKTGAFTPSTIFTLLDGQLVPRPTFGSTGGDLYREQDLRTDGPSTPIEMDCVMKRFDMEAPDYDKYWGQLSVVGRAQSAGTLDILLSVGELNATLTNTLEWDMTKSRQRLGRAGHGKHIEIELKNDEVGQDAEIFGIEVNPVNILGRR
jgi:hypothetical protein